VSGGDSGPLGRAVYVFVVLAFLALAAGHRLAWIGEAVLHHAVF